MPQPTSLVAVRRPRQGEITCKDTRKLVNAAIDRGWAYDTTGGNHARLRSPDGVSTLIIAGTASDSRGAVHRVRRAIARAEAAAGGTA